jgi:ubiquinone/menaquinone biosynthesis C-methylase UbiE
MKLYDKHILPGLVHMACSQRPVMRQRGKIVPLAQGVVLEVGIGTGLNLPYYDAGRVSKLWGIEPAPEMIRMAEPRVRSLNFAVEFINSPGECLPLRSGCIDSIVVTYTLCTIPDVGRALQEMARVLKPEGRLLFCEHGAAPDAAVHCWQNMLNPIWKRIGGGCHLNRNIPGLIEQGGFRIREIQAMYIPGWRPASYNYLGVATLPKSS